MTGDVPPDTDAAPAGPAETSEAALGAPRGGRHTVGIRRLVALALVAAMGFGLALVRFRDPSDRDCSLTTRSDQRYAVHLEGPYEGEHDHPTYRLVTTRRGQPVDPAIVCVVSFPGGVVIVIDDVRRAHIHIESPQPDEADGADEADRPAR